MQNNQECNEFEQEEDQEVENDFSELKLAEAKLELDFESEISPNVRSSGLQLSNNLFEELYESINSLDEYGFEWQPPITFEESALKQFDVNVFPNTLKNMVLAVSRFTQTPVDLAAVCLIGVLSTVLQKSFTLNQSKAGKNL